MVRMAEKRANATARNAMPSNTVTPNTMTSNVIVSNTMVSNAMAPGNITECEASGPLISGLSGISSRTLCDVLATSEALYITAYIAEEKWFSIEYERLIGCEVIVCQETDSDEWYYGEDDFRPITDMDHLIPIDLGESYDVFRLCIRYNNEHNREKEIWIETNEDGRNIVEYVNRRMSCAAGENPAIMMDDYGAYDANTPFGHSDRVRIENAKKADGILERICSNIRSVDEYAERAGEEIKAKGVLSEEAFSEIERSCDAYICQIRKEAGRECDKLYDIVNGDGPVDPTNTQLENVAGKILDVLGDMDVYIFFLICTFEGGDSQMRDLYEKGKREYEDAVRSFEKSALKWKHAVRNRL
jgi:hypothetical protein